MKTMNAGRKTLLALAISSAMTGLCNQAHALQEVTGNLTINEGVIIEDLDPEGVALQVTSSAGATITNKGNIIATKNAILITGKGSTIDNTGLIESKEGAAILVDNGAQFKSGNIAIKNTGQIIGGVIKETNERRAIDLSNLVGNVTRSLQVGDGEQGGLVKGNIYLNAKHLDNLNAGVSTRATWVEFHGSGSNKAIFDGTKIAGTSEIKILKSGYLVLEAQNETIVFELADFYSGKGTEQDPLVENNGVFNLYDNATLEMKLNGTNKDTATPVLLVDGDMVVRSGAKIKVTGDLATIAGEYTLITADNIQGYNNIEFADSWLTDSKLIDNAECTQPQEAGKTCDSIKVVVTYKEQEEVTGDILAQWAKEGGADQTEQNVIKAFGDLAAKGSNITEKEITFASAEQTELANLIQAASGSEASARLAGELTPDRSGATLHAAQRAQNKQFDAIQNRLNELRSDQYHVVNSSNSGLWFRVYGNDAKKKVNGRIDGYDVQGMGFSFGIDGELTDNLVTGFAFSQNYQDIDTMTYDTKHEVNTYQFAAYGLWNQGKYFATAAANVGVDYFDSYRTIGEGLSFDDANGNPGETRADAEYKALHYGIRLTAGMELAYDNLLIQPLIAGELNNVSIEAYDESGSVASLSYDKQSVSQAKLGAGLNITTNYEIGSGILSPHFKAMGWYDFNADDHHIAGSVIIDPTVGGEITTATGSSKTRYELAAGFDYTIDGGLSLGLGLQQDFEDDGHDTQLQARMNYAF